MTQAKTINDEEEGSVLPEVEKIIDEFLEKPETKKFFPASTPKSKEDNLPF